MRVKEPSFTFGIEEEYHLVDLETRGFAPAPAGADGGLRVGCSASRSRPSSSAPRSRSAPASAAISRLPARSLPTCAGPSPTTPASIGLAPIAASTHPFADRSTLETDAQGPLPGARARLRRHRPAPRHLRHARARRHRGRRAAHRSHEPGALFPAPPADAVDVVALLAGRGHRPQELPPRRVPRAAAHRAAPALRELRRVPAHRRRAGAQRRHRGRHQDLVGPAPVRPLPDARDARHRRLHAHRRRDLDRGALRLHPAHALPAAPLQPEVALLSRRSSSRRTAGARSATACARRCSTSARASSCRSPRSSTSCSTSSPRMRPCSAASARRSTRSISRPAAPAPTGRSQLLRGAARRRARAPRTR